MSKKVEWYQISQRQRLSPFPNYLSMESITKEIKQVIGYSYKHILLLFQNNIISFLVDKEDFQRLGKLIFKKIKNKPDTFKKLSQKLKITFKESKEFINSHNQQSYLAGLTVWQLFKLFKEFEKRYKKIYSCYFPILSVEELLINYLRDYLSKKVFDPKQVEDYLNTLTTEFAAMVNRKELEAALQVAVTISKNKKWQSYFNSKKIKNIIKKIKGDKKLERIIKNHEKRFFWLTRDYDDPVLTYEDFVTRFKKHLSSEPVKRLKTLITEERAVKKQQQKIIAKLKMDKQIIRLCQAMRNGMYNKELRKMMVSVLLYYFDSMLFEVAKRCQLTLNQVRHLKINEVLSALRGKNYSQELSHRIKSSVWLIEKGQTKIFIGLPAKKIIKQLTQTSQQKVFYGIPVSPGLTTGPIKIVINQDSFAKVKKGDIIATIQATPVFSSVIKLTKGLICDGGTGITSHPATLAREAGIPCIVGLKTSLKILKDGDLVEIDGTKGFIKILKKRKK